MIALIPIVKYTTWEINLDRSNNEEVFDSKQTIKLSIGFTILIVYLAVSIFMPIANVF
jgi:hypothetical protein